MNKEFIIHPGVTIKEKLEMLDMSVNDFADKTNYSLEYVNDVINGRKDITFEFSKTLEEVLNVDFTFWLNLQTIYNNEIGGVSNG